MRIIDHPAGFLLYEQTDKFKSEYFTAAFLSPLTPKTATQNSLLSSVLCCGSTQYPTRKLLSRRCDELYSLSLSTGTGRAGEMQETSFVLSAVSDHYAFDNTQILREGVKLLGELSCNPYLPDGHFLPAYIEQEKRNLRDRLASIIDNKAAYALNRTVKLMCANEPYAVSPDGEIEFIDGITDSDLLDGLDFIRNGVRPIMTYVGSADADTLCGYISESLHFGGNAPKIIRPTQVALPSQVRDFTEKMDVTQCKLILGYRMSKTLFDLDYVKFALFNELLGGSPTSKLFLNVREKKSLCYYCRAIPSAVKGVFFISSGIEKKNKQLVIEAIEEQIEDIRCGRFTARELEDAKKSLINAYKEITDSASSVSSWYFSRFCAGRSDSPEDAAAAVLSVTPEDVAAMAATLTPDVRFSLEG